VPDNQDGGPAVDASVPHIARIYDYWLGGKDNFAADREAARLAMAATPTIVPGVQANRRFLGRAVRHMAGAGVRQFLDVGTGIPAANNTHEVAQSIAPHARVVYVDNDPIVLSHARALLTSTTGPTAYIDADARDTTAILDQAVQTIDFSQPAGVMLMVILHCVPDEDDPAGIVAALLRCLPGRQLPGAQPPGPRPGRCRGPGGGFAIEVDGQQGDLPDPRAGGRARGRAGAGGAGRRAGPGLAARF
jgi:hypothetical protein